MRSNERRNSWTVAALVACLGLSCMASTAKAVPLPSLKFTEKYTQTVVNIGGVSSVVDAGSFSLSGKLGAEGFDPSLFDTSTPLSIKAGPWDFTTTLGQATTLSLRSKRALYKAYAPNSKGKLVMYLSVAISWGKTGVTVRVAAKTPSQVPSIIAANYVGATTQDLLAVNRTAKLTVGTLQSSFEFSLNGKVTTKSVDGKDDVAHLVSRISLAGKGALLPPEVGPDVEQESEGVMTFANINASGFNSKSSAPIVTIAGAIFSTAAMPTVYVNGNYISKGIAANSTKITIPASNLVDGLNSVEVFAADHFGLNVSFSQEFWVGTSTVKVSVKDSNEKLVKGATVALRLSDDEAVSATKIALSGVATFTNVPNRTVIATASTPDNRVGTAADVATAGALLVSVEEFEAASPIENNDISLGLDGWAHDGETASVVSHQESFDSQPSQAAAVAGADQDIALGTSGEGARSLSRTFQCLPATKSVKLRYRFITTEVPGGYFGSQFNDYFQVSIRCKNGGTSVTEVNSMNGLGLSVFDLNSGATAWRELELPVTVPSDTVQVDVVVANVADGAFDSSVEVDYISEDDAKITQLALNDIDDLPLQFLSGVPHQNSSFLPDIPVHGTITIEGPEDDSLTDLRLEISLYGSVVATATLHPARNAELLKPFGPSKKIELTTSKRLFDLDLAGQQAIESAMVGPGDFRVSLDVVAETAQGKTPKKKDKKYRVLVSAHDVPRYGDKRDEAAGGDAWCQKKVYEIITNVGAPYTWNDFSNLHGGPFEKHTSGHRIGLNVDGLLPGYQDPATGKPGAVAAAGLIDFLNLPNVGLNVRNILVSYKPQDGDPFYDVIKNAGNLLDGRSPKAVLKPDPANKHLDHFHAQFFQGPSN